MTPSAALPGAAVLDAALVATWPAAEVEAYGPFTLRRSPGGGSRVSAATLDRDTDDGPDDEPDGPGIAAAVAVMRGWGQVPRFRVRTGQDRFDARLAACGFVLRDPTRILCARCDTLARPLPGLAAFTAWPPLAVQDDIWRAAGMDAARRAVMDRARGPRTAILGRIDDQPGGTAFVAVHGEVAMMHALEVRLRSRRKGLARHMVARAAGWARGLGCRHFAVAVTCANSAGLALYAGLGMADCTGYHYREEAADAG